jgi:hypothetical protein
MCQRGLKANSIATQRRMSRLVTCSGVNTPTGGPMGMSRTSRTANTFVLWPKELRKVLGCRSSGIKLQPDQWLYDGGQNSRHEVT